MAIKFLSSDSLGYLINLIKGKIDGKADKTAIPNKMSQLSNDSGYIKNGDTLLTTNPFGGRQLYISKIDNALYCADKRWTITGKLVDSDGGETPISAVSFPALFDGNYETNFTIPKNKKAIIRITFDTSTESTAYSGVSVFPGYPYGYVYLSYYYTGTPEIKSKLRVYCNYEPLTIGEYEAEFENFTGAYSKPDTAGTSGLIERVRQPKYAISYMEFEIAAGNNHPVYVTQIDFKLDRPDSRKTPFLSKFGEEKLYNTLNTRSLIPTANNSYNIGSATNQFSNIYGTAIYENGTSLYSKYSPIAGSSSLTTCNKGTIGNAATYDVESTVANDSKLTTGAAVKSFVEEKGYTKITDIYGVCDTAAATAAKVVSIAGFSSNNLVDGATVRVKMVNANSAANPTLNVSNTGAKTITLYGTTAAGTTASNNGWYAGSIILVTYDSTLDKWVLNRGYNYNSDSGDYNQREYYSKAKAKNVIYRYQMLFTSGNYIVPINGVDNNAGMSKTVFYNDAFDIFGNIYCYNSTTTLAKDGISADGVLYTTRLVDMRYSFNNFHSTAATSLFKQNDIVYFVATPETATTVKPYYGANGTTYTACVTKTLPTTDDGLIYIQLGQMYDSYRMQLSLNHPVYQYKNGAIREYTIEPVLPTAAKDTLGVVKTTSDVADTTGLTACPIISGVPYYKEGGGGISAPITLTSTAGLAGNTAQLYGNLVIFGNSLLSMSAIAGNGIIGTYTNDFFTGKSVKNGMVGFVGGTPTYISGQISGNTLTIKSANAISSMVGVWVVGTIVIS